MIGLVLVVLSGLTFVGAVKALVPFGLANISVGSIAPGWILTPAWTQPNASVIVAFVGIVIAIAL